MSSPSDKRDPADPALELKFKIDQAMGRCQSDIDHFLKDFLSRYTPSSELDLPRSLSPSPFSTAEPPYVPEPHEMFHPLGVPESQNQMTALQASPHHMSQTADSQSPEHRNPGRAAKTQKKAKRVPIENVKVQKSQAERVVIAVSQGAEPPTFREEGTSPDNQEPDKRKMQSVLTFHDGGFGSENVSPAERKARFAANLDVDDIECFGDADADLGRANLFTSVDELKSKVLASVPGMDTSFNQADLYHETGIMRSIALHPAFEYTTYFFIFINALWMGYDTDMNGADTLFQAHLQFIVMENIFFVYFASELIIRFCAFKYKRWFYKDSWFMFDSCLVFSMILENYILSLVLELSGLSMEGSNFFVVLRLARLTRLARMARLLRALPELLIMVKAIFVSMKTVIYALFLLFVLVYVFSIAFTQLMDGKTKAAGTVAHDNFETVWKSMNTLLLQGALPDQASLIDDMRAESFVFYLMMLAFLFFASLTVMNMLIGILCDVISDVSDSEREATQIAKCKQDLEALMKKLGIWDTEGYLTRHRFESLLLQPQARRVFGNIGVDVFALVDFADIIFPKTARAVLFTDFIDSILELRGSNSATVKDVIELRKLITKQIEDQSVEQNRAIEKQGVLLKRLVDKMM